nr:hypothetical protein [Tanacetum cinerariifolium]
MSLPDSNAPLTSSLIHKSLADSLNRRVPHSNFVPYVVFHPLDGCPVLATDTWGFKGLVDRVWEHLKHFTGMANMPSALNSIVDILIPLAKMRSARSVIAKLVFAASWGVFFGSCFGYGFKEECSSVDVLFFPSPRFFPVGFSWEGFLRRQNRLDVYNPMLLLWDDFEAMCTLKWYFPIGVIVSVLFS